MADEPLLTLRELAVELKLPESTVRYYRDAFLDHIPSVGTGRRRRYPREAVAVLRSIAKSYAGGRSRSEIVSGITGTSSGPAVASLAEKPTRTVPLEDVSNLDLLAAILDGEREQRDALWQMAKEIVRLTDVLEGQDKVLNEIADRAGVIMSGSSPANLRSGAPMASLAAPPEPLRHTPIAEPPRPAPVVEPPRPAPVTEPPRPAPVAETPVPAAEPRASKPRIPLFADPAPPSTFFASPPVSSPPFVSEIGDRGIERRDTDEPAVSISDPPIPRSPDFEVGRFTSASGTDMERLRAELESERALVERLREAKLQLEHRAADAEAALEERGGKRGSVIRRLLGPDR